MHNGVKHEQIVEVALRRFSHFGIAKTTLTEVAEDLAVTKQALAHYYPDKESLVNAVAEKITNEYLGQLSAEIQGSKSVEEALLKVVEVKSYFFEKYFMLISQTENHEFRVKNSQDNWKRKIAGVELELMEGVLRTGIQRGEIKNIDVSSTSTLFLETLQAFSGCIKDNLIPDKLVFEQVLLRQQEVIKLFCQGLKSEAWEN